MSGLALHVLGPPRIERYGAPVQIGRRNVVALLIYLAVTGRSHSRDTLATLFWPEHDQSGARAGLRRTLASLKKTLGAEWLEVSRESVGLCPGAEVWLDLVRFQEHLAECQTHGHGPERVCPACMSSLDAAATLYGDDFFALQLYDQREAGERRFALNEYRARTALSGVTALLCTGESQFFP